MKNYHKTYKTIFGKSKLGGDIKEAQKRRTYRKVSNWSLIAGDKKRNE